jgi:GDP-4-dehydro-6-deoxy-D-mannose reductase
MRILITGINGFAGGHLAELLLREEGVQLVGVSRHPHAATPWHSATDKLQVRGCDLCLPGPMEALLREVEPRQIYHLAGYANTARSFTEPEAAWQSNLTATRTLYEAIERWGGRPRILFVSSGIIYGQSENPNQAQDEETLLRPANPYASSKAAADLVSYQFSLNPGLDIVRARPFNHIGPRQQPSYAIPSFARQIVAIERRQQPPILETGNLMAERDLTDVRDVVLAYRGLMQRGQQGEAYNIASGQNWTMQAILEKMLILAGVQVEIRHRLDLLRKIDQSTPRVETGKIRGAIGWKPTFRLEETLRDILDFWRTQ